MSETVLVLCTGNICRSPIAAALLRARLDARAADVVVESAGVMGLVGRFADPAAVQAAAELGGQLDDHRSRALEPALLQEADLVLAMAREHLREAATLHPPAWQRSFTLKELVRRCRRHGPRPPGVDLRVWTEELSTGRTTAEMLGASPDDDVADPIGQPEAVFRATAHELDTLVQELVSLLWPEP